MMVWNSTIHFLWYLIIIKFVVLLEIFPHLLPAYYRRLINIISFLESAWQSLVNKENLNKSFIKNFLHEKFKIKYRVKKESCTAILNPVKQANNFLIQYRVNDEAIHKISVFMCDLMRNSLVR